MKLGNVVVAALLFLAWLFVVIGMGTLGWMTSDKNGAKVDVGLLRYCVEAPGTSTCNSLSKIGENSADASSCKKIKHGGGFAFSFLLFAIFPGLIAIATNAIAAVEMEVGPLDAALLPKLNFALSTAFAVLTFIAWIFYCIISYSTKCYKDSFKAGYSFALVVVGFFLFQLPAAGLNACEFLGIAVPGLVEGGGAGGAQAGGV
ncbi:uncharacterized protein AMSG_04423 [Thecamonas trahens ATCC 50062]|uniref:MARVEL domain-containing protein n=1 Tax=Thecamonas trahens ATCC 50062 TaxID=461836 RepID=A0A0L0D772_THETB|nr:hypothetical protein AMSG_04423 [Thecamonas trahens ATCC 50062]KNC48194.1 hypothetical protein AMSG_04423 [Thecamonas trahens ATCC 50062]|eukprot:XP_013758763.1 hypothetical protein AMSG_04423 [Thecamonas trahens ATCC 50062]